MGLNAPLKDFSLIWRRHHCRRMPENDSKYWPMLGTHGLEQWGFFSVPHPLWHGASVHNGTLRGPMAPIAERLAVELSLPVYTTWVCRGLDSNTQPSACGANALSHCATAAVHLIYIYTYTRFWIIIIFYSEFHNFYFFEYDTTFHLDQDLRNLFFCR